MLTVNYTAGNTRNYPQAIAAVTARQVTDLPELNFHFRVWEDAEAYATYHSYPIECINRQVPHAELPADFDSADVAQVEAVVIARGFVILAEV